MDNTGQMRAKYYDPERGEPERGEPERGDPLVLTLWSWPFGGDIIFNPFDSHKLGGVEKIAPIQENRNVCLRDNLASTGRNKLPSYYEIVYHVYVNS